VFLILNFSLFSSFHLRAQIPAICEGIIPDSCQGQNFPWETFRDTIELSDYPGCKIEVIYRMKGCRPWNYARVDSIRFPDQDTCMGLISDLLPLGIFGGVNHQFYYDFWRRLHDSIAVRTFRNYYFSLPPQLRSKYHCNSNEAMFTWYFIEGSCRALCLRRVNYGIFGKWWVSTYLKCKEACCLYSAKICYDPITGQVIFDPASDGPIEITDYNDWRNCINISLPYSQCSQGVFNYLGPCEQYCPSDVEP